VGDRLRLALSLSLPPIVGVLIAAVWWPGVIFAVLVAAYMAAHVVTIPSDASRRVSLSAAVAGATALMSGGSLVLVLGPAAVALPIGWLIVHLRHGKRVTQSMFPAEAVGIVAFAAAFAAMLLVVPSTDPAHPLILTAFAGAALFGFLVTVVTNAIVSEERRVVARRLIALRAFDDWPAYAALLSSAALLAVTADPMGAWSAPLAGFPYLFSHVSLHRLQGTRRTYDQTIRALGAIPEASGQVPAGHSSRTAELAVAVGAEIGLGTSELRRLEYAALLHDIGRVVLVNPAVARGRHSLTDVAGWSAAIIGEARHLERVAQIVALQHAPYRKEGEVRDQAVPRTSQLVRITARYDVALEEGDSPLAALELMHRGAAYDYDPEVVMALRRVLERRGSLAA
jgi:hypothetical protein